MIKDWKSTDGEKLLLQALHSPTPPFAPLISHTAFSQLCLPRDPNASSHRFFSCDCGAHLHSVPGQTTSLEYKRFSEQFPKALLPQASQSTSPRQLSPIDFLSLAEFIPFPLHTFFRPGFPLPDTHREWLKTNLDPKDNKTPGVRLGTEKVEGFDYHRTDYLVYSFPKETKLRVSRAEVSLPTYRPLGHEHTFRLC